MKTNGFRRPKAPFLGPDSKRFSRTPKMGFSRHPAFRPQIGFDGRFSFLPSILVSLENMAPERVAEGISPVLIGALPHLEYSPNKEDTQIDLTLRDATSEKGGPATRWGCT